MAPPGMKVFVTIDLIMGFHLFIVKPWPKSVLIYCKLETWNKFQYDMNKELNFKILYVIGSHSCSEAMS